MPETGGGAGEPSACLRKENRETIYEAGWGNMMKCSKQTNTKLTFGHLT